MLKKFFEERLWLGLAILFDLFVIVHIVLALLGVHNDSIAIIGGLSVAIPFTIASIIEGFDVRKKK